MSVSSFVESAKILYNHQKYAEALCLICNAIDACAQREVGKNSNDKNHVIYKQFLKKHFVTICEYGFPGILASNIQIKVNVPIKDLKPNKEGYVDMEQIIYHVIRCGLVHNCKIEETIEFTETTMIGDWNEKFLLPKDIIFGLVAAVNESEGLVEAE